MMLEIAVHLGFAGGLGEGAWGLGENVPWGNGRRCWVGLIGVGLDDELAFELERGDLAVDVDLPLVVLV